MVWSQIVCFRSCWDLHLLKISRYAWYSSRMHSVKLVVSISSSRSSSKLVKPEGLGATFLMTGSSSQILVEKSVSLCVSLVTSFLITNLACFLLATKACNLFQVSHLWCLSSSILRNQDIHSFMGTCCHCSFIHGGPTSLETRCSFFCRGILSPCSFASHSFLIGSSYALVNPYGCWQSSGHRSKCTSCLLHPIEGSWNFNQSVPRSMSPFPRCTWYVSILCDPWQWGSYLGLVVWGLLYW